MARPFRPCVLTANDLLSGEVVYLAPGGAWTPRLGSAHLFEEEEEANRRLAQAERCEDAIIGPYLAAARAGGSRRTPEPVHFREAFRATGPTNYPHGKREGT